MTNGDFFGIMVSGAFGGLLSSLYLNDGKLVFPERTIIDGKKGPLHLGVFADIILGAGAGLVASIPMDLAYPKYIYVAVIAGFGGGNFIAKQAKVTAEQKVDASGGLPDLNVPTSPLTTNESDLVELEITTNEDGGNSHETKNNPN